MTDVPWTRVVPLGNEHDLECFRSGRDSVDTWLREKARGASHLIAIHLCLDDAGVVCGFSPVREAVEPRGPRPGCRFGDAVAEFLQHPRSFLGIVTHHRGELPTSPSHAAGVDH